MLTELFTKMEFDFLDGVTFTSNKARFSPEKENRFRSHSAEPVKLPK